MIKVKWRRFLCASALDNRISDPGLVEFSLKLPMIDTKNDMITEKTSQPLAINYFIFL